MKSRKKKILIQIIMLIMMIVLLIPNQARAGQGTQSYIVNPNDFNPNANGGIKQNDINTVTRMVKPVVNVIAIIGTIASVVTLMLIGLKYMMGSVEEKAEYKKTMIPYLIGVIILFGISTFLNIILKMTQGVF